MAGSCRTISTGRRDIESRPPLIVFIDSVSIGNVTRLADAAARCGIATALVCPRGAGPRHDPSIAAIVETDDFTAGSLRRILRRLDRRFTIRGLHSSFGPFRDEGFVHGAVAQLAAERQLAYSSADAMLAATNKYIARTRFAAANLPDVRFAIASDARSLRSASAHVRYPLILKPLTGVGSSLVFRCADEDEAHANLKRGLAALPRAHYAQLRMAPHEADGMRFDPARSMLVEEYLDGREASVECLVSGDRVTPLLVHDKLDVEEVPGVVFEHLLVTPAARFTRQEVHAMKQHAARAVAALGLRDMFCHVELRWVDGAGPRVLEVNPRIGAGCVTESIETFTTIDVDATRVSLILGQRPKPFRMRRASRHAMIFLFSPRKGRLVEFSGLDEISTWPGVRALHVGASEGDRVGGDTEEIFLSGIFLKAADETAARHAYERIRETVRIRVV